MPTTESNAAGVVYLERDAQHRLWAVAHVDASILPAVAVRVAGRDVLVSHDLYWSAQRIQDPDTGELLLRSLALTPYPARLGAAPVTLLDGELDYRGVTFRWRLDTPAKSLLERAASAYVPRRFDATTPLRIRDAGPPGPGSEDYWPEDGATRTRAEAPRGSMRRAGSRGRVLSVR